MRVRLEVEPPDGTTSDLARRLEEVIPPEVREGLLGTELLDAIKDRLSCGIRISLEILTFLKKEWLDVEKSVSRPPHTW